MEETTVPRLVCIKNGWAALGKDWAVFGKTREEALQNYREADSKHKEILSRAMEVRAND